jgi:cellulose synthase/poly-beta-1,6-N-acetylglucosamine synthase-like glycosyltransferase
MMTLLLILYFCTVGILTLYGLNAHVMIHLFKRRVACCVEEDRALLEKFYRERGVHDLPMVTSQIPIYNELNVAERVIDAVFAFEYPYGKHEIQILDDSTDETSQIIAQKVEHLKGLGVLIEHIRRSDRQGFKAGALKYGMETARGEFLAIFDADFIPPEDFLLKTIPFLLLNPQVGFVQGRWGHLNRGKNLLTRIQALVLDSQFVVEHTARSWNHLFVGFNGTAGIMRKQAIIEAGNWQYDTLTEDIDLSYRIQLAGWNARYLIDIVSPAELPADLRAFKAQQFRWVKGTIQTALKLLPRIWHSNVNLVKKLHATLHLTHHLTYPLMVILVIITPILLIHKGFTYPSLMFSLLGGVMFLGFMGPSRMYLTAQKYLSQSWRRQLLLFPLVICLGGGMAVNNTKAVFEALRGKKSEFIRTPKQGEQQYTLYTLKRNSLFILEIILSVWNLLGVFSYVMDHHYLMGYMFLLYSIGPFLFGGESLLHRRKHLLMKEI